MIAYLSGSGFYDHPALQPETVSTSLGEVTLLKGELAGAPALMLPRHGSGHRNLPHHIPHRANLLALKEAGASAVISLSVCGILDASWPLAKPMITNDLFFPDNRLGDGSVCSMFQEPGEAGRGHLLAGTLFNSGLRGLLNEHIGETLEGCYAHVPGPRFNSVSEIRFLQQFGCQFLSQTCGPEAVLANELELPYAMVAFGIDYANGVKDQPTPVEVLDDNLKAAADFFHKLVDSFQPAEIPSFENFVYRFA